MGPGAAGSGSVLKCEQGGVRLGVRLYISVFLPPLPAALMWHTVSSRGPIRNADSFPDPRDGYHCVQSLLGLWIHSIANASGYMGDLKKSNWWQIDPEILDYVNPLPRASPYWQLNSKRATWPGLRHQESSAIGQGSVCEPHSSVLSGELLLAPGQLEKPRGEAYSGHFFWLPQHLLTNLLPFPVLNFYQW